MSTKVKIVSKVAEHPFTKKAITKMDLVKLTGKLADDDPMGDQMADTLDVNSTAKIWKCCACFTGFCCTPVNILLLLVTGFMAFANPDPEECWVSDAEPGVIYTSDPSIEGFMNFGQIFRVWYLVGFIMVALWSILSIVFMVGVCTKNGIGLCISTFGLILHVVNIVWCIYGYIVFMTPAAMTAMGVSESEQAEPTFTTEASASFSTDPSPSSSSNTMEVSGIAWFIIWADLAVIAVLYIIFPIICCIASCCASKDDN